jgi:hypothetical protein
VGAEASASSAAKSLVCRQIEESDLDQVIALLTQGFRSQRNGQFWRTALDRLARHDAPDGYPRFGYALQAEGSLVGVILLIFTQLRTGAIPVLRCNLSSWYVIESFRPYASLLISRALRHREATYSNLTAMRHTFAILEAQGFRRYAEGRFVAIPALTLGGSRTQVMSFKPGVPCDGISAEEADLLADHAGCGCISLVCRQAGEAYPFVLAPRWRFGALGMALLAYCRDTADFVRCAGPIGRFLLRRGIVLVLIDADGAIRGLVGRYDGNKPKFFRGPHRPRQGDLAYSERTMFGA